MKADVLRDVRCMMAEGRCVISLFHSHLVSYNDAPRLLSGARLLSFFRSIFEHESHGLNGLLYTPIPQKAQKGAITDGDIYEGRLKARNHTKFDSKLYKIYGAITDGDI